MFNRKKDIKRKYSYIDVKNLPVLILDSNWLQLFPKGVQTEEMTEAEEELRRLLKEQGGINEKIKKLSANKKSLLSQILSKSNDVREKNTADAKAELEESQNKVEKINEALKELEEQAELIPDKIEEANNRLFQLSVREIYNKIGKKIKEVKKCEANIDKLRKQLSEETEKKEKLEETFKSGRDFLVDYIGYDGMKQLDDKYNGSI